MDLETTTGGAVRHTSGAGGDRTVPGSGRLGREGLIAKFHDAVRRPDAFGGLSVLPLLLDLIAEAEGQTGEVVWLPDTNERFGTLRLVRDLHPDPDIQVAASQYGEDAYRRGWLRLERILGPAEHAALVDGAGAWAETDRTVHDVLDEFGPASITFGDPDPGRPKTLGYAGSDREEPFVAFHFGPERTTSAGAALLAVHGVVGACLDLQYTPHGRAGWTDRSQRSAPTV